ncbi:MAG: FAD-binding oxidoreductase [Robiginitomaculum sp.]
MNLQMCIEELQSVLPGDVLLKDARDIKPFLEEWRGRWIGKTPLTLRPRTTKELATAVSICARHKTPITVQGGNTGLVGGQVPQGEILLLTTGLNQIISVDKDDMSMSCEAGVTLHAVREAAKNAGLLFPLSLASEGSCTIGGNLSTNAGGAHVLKYGTTRQLCYGVEAVLADGSIYDGLTSLRKDNTGYDLSQLLLGAEGTLGIITAACLKLFPQPVETAYVFVGVQSPQAALTLLTLLRNQSALSMFELIPRLGIDYVCAHMGGRDPLSEVYPWYILLEWEEGQNSLEQILSKAIESDSVEDVIIAKSKAQANALLALRENMSAAQKPIGATIKHDISVPIYKVPTFIQQANKAVTNHITNCRPLPFGHMGDGNIHYNIGQPKAMNAEAFMAQEEAINNIVYDIVSRLGGSISAEHGIGILKKEQLQKRAESPKLQMMRQIKLALDPSNILNPKVLFY